MRAESTDRVFPGHAHFEVRQPPPQPLKIVGLRPAGRRRTYIGGAEATTFILSARGFGAGDTVTGGSSDDTLIFASAGTLTACELERRVSGVETIDLANGTNAITLSNARVGPAHNATLRVNGGMGADTINASAVSTATDTVIIDGGAGADVIDAGAAHDVFIYNAASDSAGAATTRFRASILATIGSILARRWEQFPPLTRR